MDKIYECNICNYKTKSRSNLSHYNKTKKHLVKTNAIYMNSQQTPSKLAADSEKYIEKNDYVCEYCNKHILRYNNVSRHLNSCIQKKEGK